MKFSFPKSYILTLIVLSLLILQPVSISGQIENVFYPEFHSPSVNFESNENNDIFLRTKNHQEVISNSFETNQPTDHYSYDDKQRLNFGMQSGNTPFAINHPAIQQFDNRTNEDLELNYRTTYFSLLDGEERDVGDDDVDQGTPENIVLSSHMDYGFVVNINQLGPHILRLMTDTIQSGSAYWMEIRIVSPSGFQSSISQYFRENTEEFVPFVPQEEGKHIMFLTPFESIILGSIGVEETPEIVEGVNGISEHIQEETEIIGKFIRIKGFGAPTAIIMDILTTTYSYMGYVSIRLFNPNTQNQFGSSIASSSVAVITSRDIYISVVLTPIDEENPIYSGTKDDLGLEDGMDIEYSVLVNVIDLPQLPRNMDFSTRTQQYSDNAHYYQFQTSSPAYAAINTTSPAQNPAYFYPMDNTMDTITLNPSSADFINDQGDRFVMIPAGMYSVRLPQNERYHVTFLSFDDIEMDETRNFNLETQERELLKSRVDDFQLSRFNLSIVSEMNYSATVYFNLHNRDGMLRNTNQLTFTQNNSTGTFVMNNKTMISQIRELGDSYISIHLDALSLYYDNGSIITMNPPTNSLEFELVRFDDEMYIERTTNNNQITRDTIQDTYMESIHSNYTTYNGYFLLPTEADTAYRLTIDSLNRSISDADLLVGSNTYWYSSLSQFSSQDINNETHYILILQFATTEAMTLGLHILLGIAALNATLNIAIETLSILSLPDLNLLEINDDQLPEERGLLGSPVLWFGLLGVVIVGLLVYRRYFAA